MSHVANKWLAEQRGLKPAEFVVLFHLCDCHNPQAGCFPSQQYLAEAASMSRASVNTHLAGLEKRGLIERERQFDPASKKHRPTRYRLGFEMGDREAVEPCPDIGRGEGAVSNSEPEPCPIPVSNSRVQNLDTNLVREPVKGTSKKGNAQRAFHILRSVASDEVARDFVAHRQAIGKPMTERAAELIVAKVGNHPDADAVLNLSIENGWTGIFPQRLTPQHSGARHDRSRRPDPRLEAARRAAEWARTGGP